MAEQKGTPPEGQDVEAHGPVKDVEAHGPVKAPVKAPVKESMEAPDELASEDDDVEAHGPVKAPGAPVKRPVK